MGRGASVGAFYAVEIETAPDGQSAIVRARGDLDGDGVESSFELDVQMTSEGGEPKIAIAPEIRERDPFE